MPTWIITAMALLRGLTPRLAGPLATRVALPAGAGVGGALLGGLLTGDGDVSRRRRRRRALTQSDRNDIAFITATLGATAGKQFAMIIASRVG